MIHHETVTARLAPSNGDNGEGAFDVIESGGEFQVLGDGGLLLSSHGDLRAAIAAAKREATNYDERRRAEAREAAAREARAEIARTRRLRCRDFELRDLSARFHRNGVFGEGFTALSFRARIRGCGRGFRPMIAAVFEGSGRVAVIEPDNIRNRWRGDDFEPLLRQAVQAFDESGELFDHSGADNL